MKKTNQYKIKIFSSLLAAILLLVINSNQTILFIALFLMYSLFQAMDLYHESKLY